MALSTFFITLYAHILYLSFLQVKKGNWAENELARINFGCEFPHYYTKNSNVFEQ